MAQEVPEEPKQDAEARELDFEAALQILFRRRKFILLFTVGVTLLVCCVLLLMKDQYTASAIILPPGQNASASSALLSQLGGVGILGGSLGVKTPTEMILSLMRSQTVEDTVIKRFDLQKRFHAKKLSDARVYFEKASKLSAGTKDGLITVRYTDHDGALAAAIVNGYIEEYQKFSNKIAFTEASQRRLFYEQQLLEVKENLVKAEMALKETEQKTGVLQLEGQTRTLIESVAALRAQVVAKEVELESMRSYATENNPEYQQAKQQLSALQEQLARQGGSDEDAATLNPKGNVSESALEYIRKVRDVRYYETISELIAKQYEIAKQDEARQGALLQVVEPATPPDTKSGPRRTLAAMLAFLMAFFVGSGWCLLEARLPKPLFRKSIFRPEATNEKN